MEGRIGKASQPGKGTVGVGGYMRLSFWWKVRVLHM